jgi:hypothetical protein
LTSENRIEEGKMKIDQVLKNIQECYDGLYKIVLDDLIKNKTDSNSINKFLEECRTAPEGTKVTKYYQEFFDKGMITKKEYETQLLNRKSFLESLLKKEK